MKNTLFFEKMRNWHANQSHCSTISSLKPSLCFSQYGVTVFALLYFLEAFKWLLLLPRAFKKCTRPRPDLFWNHYIPFFFNRKKSLLCDIMMV